MPNSVENAHELLNTAQTARKLYAVIWNCRYDTQIRRLRHVLRLDSIVQSRLPNRGTHRDTHPSPYVPIASACFFLSHLTLTSPAGSS